MLNLTQSFQTLKHLRTAKTFLIENPSDISEIPFPYYMKIDSSIHKKKAGGVIRCDTPQEAKDAYTKLKKKFKERIVVQEEIVGTEIILGLKEDDVFGKLLLIGFGGETLEKKDIAFRALPINRSQIKKTIKKLRNYPKIKKLAIEKLLTLIEMFLVIADQQKIIEADLNPIILTKTDAVIVDARIKLSD